MATPLLALSMQDNSFFFIKHPSFLLKINSDIKEKAHSMVKMIFWRKLVQDEDGGKIFIKEPFHTNI
jgi:hypothetical protein